MAGRLVQVSTTTVDSSSPVSSVTLTGITDNSVYFVAISNAKGSVDNKAFRLRVSTSGTVKDTDYAVAYHRLRTDQAFTDHAATSDPSVTWLGGAGTGTGEAGNLLLYLYNMYDSSEYSYGTQTPVGYMSTPKLEANTGAWIRKVAEENNEIHFYLQDSSQFNSGTFTLYKVTS